MTSRFAGSPNDSQAVAVAGGDKPFGATLSAIARKPFLKWAGGKTQLIAELSKYIPARFNTYIEPFMGGGALFFHMAPEKAVIADLNEELVVTYRCVKDRLDEVIKLLKTYRNEEDFYYRVRALKPAALSEEERAARLIYLNKTCFNGLYRVNKNGAFNVPYGKRTSDFLQESTLRNAGQFLKGTTILHSDYKQTLAAHARKGDFVFLDPPYYPVGKNADFKRYTKEFFYHDDQVALKAEFDALVARGCHVLLTNSDHPVVLELYSEYRIEIVETKRLISSNPNTRTGKDIIVIGG